MLHYGFSKKLLGVVALLHVATVEHDRAPSSALYILRVKTPAVATEEDNPFLDDTYQELGKER